jgi:hypothetical protein
MLADFRLERFKAQIRRAQLADPETPKAILVHYRLREDPIGYVIYQQENARPGLAIHPERFGSWWPEIQQRLLIVNHLRLECLKSGELNSLFLTNARNLLLFVRNVIGKTNPEEAIALKRIVSYEGTWHLGEEQKRQRGNEPLDGKTKIGKGLVHCFSLATYLPFDPRASQERHLADIDSIAR